VNVITGHAGQISLGHQAFVGIGAFSSAFVVTKLGGGFVLGVLTAAGTGAVMALALGLVALRVKGLYLALITLSFGLMAESTIFNLREFTGGGAGTPAPRPAGFASERAYAYLALLVLALFLFVDWRLVRSKAGRAIVALRNEERVAATLGVNVVGYKLFAFVLGGLMAGVAGSLLAHRIGFANAEDFQFQIALVWILMAVVGGLGSRAGVVIGSMFFAMFQTLVPEGYRALPAGAQEVLTKIGINEVSVVIVTPLIGAILLILTLTLYPGGIGQQLLPIRRWLAGGPFRGHRRTTKRRRSTPVVGPGGAVAAASSVGAGGDEDATAEIPRAGAEDPTTEIPRVRGDGAPPSPEGRAMWTRRGSTKGTQTKPTSRRKA
jgi:branched-chain amino acid transport system permease protein